MEKAQIVDRILKARDDRNDLRLKFSNEGLLTLSLNLNIPGYPKSNEQLSTFFSFVKEDLLSFFKAHRIVLDISKGESLPNAAGDFFILPVLSSDISAQKLKDHCELFEMGHPLGRLIDVDVTDQEGNPISSNKQKECFFCGEYSAYDCARAKRHLPPEMESLIAHEVQIFLDIMQEEKICRKLSSLALRSILYEVSLSPKPGLVDAQNSGIHQDMDYYSFLDSSSELANYFYDLAKEGYLYEGEIKDALPKIRRIGLLMEKQMLLATGNVNTQKGIIFLMGVAIFAAASYVEKKEGFSLTDFATIVKEMGKDVMSEFEQNQDLTHGIEVSNTYGKEVAGGARGELASGFATALQFGVPVLQEASLKEGMQKEKEETLSQALLQLIAHNNDTNVLYRSDLDTLKELQSLSQQAFSAFGSDNFLSYYQKIDDFCHRKKVSPGGAADLLALSVFIYFTHNEFNNAS